MKKLTALPLALACAGALLGVLVAVVLVLAPGARAADRGALEAKLTAGREEAKVPNVIGQLRREAVEAVRAAGLVPVVEEEETEVEEKIGRVIDQFPTPGSQVEPKSEVTLVVGKRAVLPEELEEEP